MKRLLRCTRGATSIEYAMIASLVSVIAIFAFVGVTNSLHDNYYQLIQSIPR